MAEEILLRLSRSQHMALLDVLISYIQLADQPQEFVDCSLPSTPTTRTGELLHLVADAVVCYVEAHGRTAGQAE